MLIDAIPITPGERRGEVQIALRGDLVAFMRLEEDGTPTNVAAPRARQRNGRSDGVMGTLVAGTRNRLDLPLTN